MEFFYLKIYFRGKSFSMTKKMALWSRMLSLDGEIHISHKNIFHIYPYTENVLVWRICIAEHLLMHQCDCVIITEGEIQGSCAAWNVLTLSAPGSWTHFLCFFSLMLPAWPCLLDIDGKTCSAVEKTVLSLKWPCEWASEISIPD